MHRISMAAFGLALAISMSPARADDASRLKLAREVVIATRAVNDMRATMPVMTAWMRTFLGRQGVVDKGLIDRFVSRLQRRMDDETPRFLDLAADVYAKEFSEEDLQNLLVFYKTPAGQHLLEKTAMLGQAMLVMRQRWGQDIANGVAAEIDREQAAGASPKP